MATAEGYVESIIQDVCKDHAHAIKEIIVENREYLAPDFDFGIVIPTFNRPEYLKYFFYSVKTSNLAAAKVVFLIFDDASEPLSQGIIKDFHLENIPIIKILTTRTCGPRTVSQTTLPGPLYPLTLQYGFRICFRLGAKYSMSQDSDAIVCKNWLGMVKKTLENIHDENFMLAGFRCQDFYHKIIPIDNPYYDKMVSFGGINITFNKSMFEKYMPVYNYAYDWMIVDQCNKHNIPMYAIKKSIIQHIGVHSSIIRGEKNYLDKCFDCNINEIDELMLIELDKQVKTVHDFPFAADFDLYA